MKKQFFTVVLLLLAVFTISVATYANVKKEVAKEIVSEKPTTQQLEIKENFKVDDAEFTVGLISKSNLGSLSGFSSEGVALIGIFSLFTFFNRKTLTCIALLGLAMTLDHYFAIEAGAAMAFVIPAIPTGNSVKVYRDVLGQIQKRMDEILTLGEKEKRTFTTEEASEYDQLEARFNEIKPIFDRLANNEKRKKDLALELPAVHNGDNNQFSEKDQRDLNKYKITRALGLRIEGRQLDGVEAEVEKEGRKETISGANFRTGNGLYIPSFLVRWGAETKEERSDRRAREKRAVTIGTEGTDVMQTTLGELIPALRPNPVTAQLGARFLTGLRGDFQLPRKTTVSSLQWQTENGAVTGTTPAFDNIKLSPKRTANYLEWTNQSQIQSSFDMENILRQDLQNELELEVDLQAIAGPGTGNKPTGVLYTSGIGAVSHGAAGGAETWAKVLEYIKDIDVANANQGSLKWLSTFLAKAANMNTSKVATDTFGNFIMNAPDELAGYPILFSNQVPSNLAKGAHVATDLSAVIFGNWQELYIGMFGGVNLIIDNVTQAATGTVRLYIEQFMDSKLRHAASFAAAADVVA